MTPRVSVAITTYNQAAYIGDTIRSVLAQTYADREIVVVDDGSTDETPDVVTQFGDAVRYIREGNRGVAGARNSAVDVARGELIAFLDGDDLWEPAKLARQVEVYDAHPTVGLIANDVVLFADDTALWDHGFAETVFASSAEQVLVGDFYTQLIDRVLVSTVSQAMIPAAVLQDVGPSRETLPVGSDYDLYLRIASRYPVAFINEVLTRWRFLATSASGAPGVRELRWARDVLQALREHVREARHTHVTQVRERIQEQERELAWRAYQLGLQGQPAVARSYLWDLVTRGQLRPAAYYTAVSLPDPVRRAARSTMAILRARGRAS